MNKKGFTLIELIAVVVIMGMILLIVFPATTRLIRSNEDKKYDTYYDAVQQELELYARTRRDELGGINGNGCAEDKRLSELLDYDYISEYKEDKGVTCLSPGDYSTNKLVILNIDPSKDYIDVRIDNKKGKISVQYSMICVKNFDDPAGMSLLYKKLIEKSSTCESYVPETTNSLINEIKGKYTVEVEPGTATSFVKGTPNNNYVLYSGKLWRIISYNENDRTIKLVSDDIVSLASYDNKTFETYERSNIALWLDKYFLPTLRNPYKFLIDERWYYSQIDSNPSAQITSGDSYSSKVGLLNNYEYIKGKTFLTKSDEPFWLVSRVSGNANNAWYVNGTGDITSGSMSTFAGVRPAIVLKPNITFVNGTNGTLSNPYKLTGDLTGNIGANLNSRYAGEYVTYNYNLYRISKSDAKYTKLISVNTIPVLKSGVITMNTSPSVQSDPIDVSTIEHITPSNYNESNGTIGFHFFDESYSDNSFIGSYLKMWAEAVHMGDELVEGDFCTRSIANTTSQTEECPQNKIINTKYGIPELGDLYATKIADKSYWTANNSTDSTINIINSNGTVSAQPAVPETNPQNYLYSIRPVIVVANTVTITGGNGTSTSPYTIE